MVFSVLLSEGREGCLSSLVYHMHVKIWHTSVEELCRLARENTLKLQPYVFRSMSEVIKESIGMSAVDSEEADPEEEGMYVLSNKSGIYGAAVILYNSVLRDISEKLEADLIILPSSVHEVIIIPYEEELSLEGLGEMVKVINQTEVPKEDWLSDNVYHYSRETGTVTVAFKTMAE